MRRSSQAYSWPFLYAVLLHVLVLAFLVIQIEMPVSSTGSATPAQNIVHAVAVSQQVLDQYQAAVKATQQAKIAQQQALIKQQQIQQQQALLQQQQLQQQKLLAAQQAAQAVAKLKAQQIAAQQAAAAKAAQQAQKQVQLKKLKQQLTQDLNQQLASDQQEINQNTSQINQDQATTDKYKALIIQAISQQWIVPQNLADNISCELLVRVAPGGAVLSVELTKSSGNTVLDNSAIAAVNKASPLPVPTDPDLFDKFRELNLTVRPDGSMTDN